MPVDRVGGALGYLVDSATAEERPGWLGRCAALFGGPVAIGCDRWSALRRRTPRAEGPISRAGLAMRVLPRVGGRRGTMAPCAYRDQSGCGAVLRLGAMWGRGDWRA